MKKITLRQEGDDRNVYIDKKKTDYVISPYFDIWSIFEGAMLLTYVETLKEAKEYILDLENIPSSMKRY